MMKMGYIGTPVQYEEHEGSIWLARNLPDMLSMLDSLVEMVVFTPRGSFTSDPDFGFEYWNHEYSNVHFRDFNSGHGSVLSGVTRQACEDSIRQSLQSYGPMLKDVTVSVELNLIPQAGQSRRRTFSKYEVVVNVSGQLEDGLETRRAYSKNVRFLMEPTARKMVI